MHWEDRTPQGLDPSHRRCGPWCHNWPHPVAPQRVANACHVLNNAPTAWIGQHHPQTVRTVPIKGHYGSGTSGGDGRACGLRFHARCCRGRIWKCPASGAGRRRTGIQACDCRLHRPGNCLRRDRCLNLLGDLRHRASVCGHRLGGWCDGLTTLRFGRSRDGRTRHECQQGPGNHESAKQDIC
jgi:hypothetical protein